MHCLLLLETSKRKRPRVPPGPTHTTPPQAMPLPSTCSTQPGAGDTHQCPECLQTPCLVLNPPSFLKGSGMADIGNVHKRYHLYRKCWSHLQKEGLWKNSIYLERKAIYTTIDDLREIMPWCICQVIL